MSSELLRDYRVREFMSKKVFTVDKEATAAEAVEVMVGHGIGCVVATSAGSTVGVLTERDLVESLAEKGALGERRVQELMDPGVNRVPKTTGSKDAARLMTETKGRLLVFDSGHLAGLVTATDLVRVVWRLGADFGLEGVLTRKVVSMESWMPIVAAVKLMHEHRVGSVILNDQGSPCGIITERDLLNRVLYGGLGLDQPSSGAATRPLVSAEAGIRGAAAAGAMVERKIKRLPLSREGRIVGVVTSRDVVEAYAFSGGTSEGDRQRNLSIRPGELCPICGLRIDSKGLCGCGTLGGD